MNKNGKLVSLAFSPKIPVILENHIHLKKFDNNDVDFNEIAKLWKTVSDLFYQVGGTGDEKCIDNAFKILLDLSEKERITMEKLKNPVSNNVNKQ